MIYSLRPQAMALLCAMPLSVFLSNCDSSPPAFVERPATYDGVVSQLDPSQNAEGVPTFAAAEWTFAATDVESAELVFDPSSEIVDHTFRMKYETVDASVEHQQLDRSVATEVFAQGSELQNMSEGFQQNDSPSGLLDILVVIDNSGSMAEEQQNLSTKLSPLLSYVQDSDWRIGVVTTDPDDGCLRGLVNKGDRNPQQAFAAAVTAGTRGTGIEQGIRQAVNSLSGNCSGGQNWVRENSTIAVLLVSDEDNCSDGTRCNNQSWSYADHLIDYLDSQRELGVNARVYGLLWHPSQDQSQCSTALRQAPIYAEVIDATSGSWGSICDSDYTDTLQSISLDISVILKNQFALQYAPLENSVAIEVDGTPMTSGYAVKGNVIEFSDPPPAGAQVSIDYSFMVDPPKSEFTIYGNADPASLEVYLDGSQAERFNYDANSKTVRFNKAPVAREIKIVYRENLSLPTDFAIEPGLEADAMVVSVNGESLSPAEYLYLADSGNIRFSQAPADGATIKVAYDRPVGPQLRYPAFVPAERLSDFEVYDAATGNPLAFAVEGQDIVFADADYEFGREILVRYDNPFATDSLLDLGYDMIEGSLRVSSNIEAGDCDKAIYDGSQIDLSPCGFALEDLIYVNFDFVRQHNLSFDLESADYKLEIDDSYRFSVFVDGEPVGNDVYKIEGQQIIFNELPLFSTITVKLYRARDS